MYMPASRFSLLVLALVALPVKAEEPAVAYTRAMYDAGKLHQVTIAVGKTTSSIYLAAAAVDPSLYRWSLVPQGKDAVTRYVETAMAWRDAGTAFPFAIVRLADGAVIEGFDVGACSAPPDNLASLVP